MYPTLENIREIAAKGQYKRVPVCREVYADRYTPVEVMRTLRKASRHCYSAGKCQPDRSVGTLFFPRIRTGDGNYLHRRIHEDPSYRSGQ